LAQIIASVFVEGTSGPHRVAMVRADGYTDVKSDDEESQSSSYSSSEEEPRGASRSILGAWLSALFFVAFVVGAVTVLVLSLRRSQAAERARSRQQHALHSEIVVAPSTTPLAPPRSEARLRQSSLPDTPEPPAGSILATGTAASGDTPSWRQTPAEEEEEFEPLAQAQPEAAIIPATFPTPHCGENEEMLAGLCYRKCSLLTDGQYPQRLASNACHKDAAEGHDSMAIHKGLAACEGFNVGDEELCPHAPFIGSCDLNEELHAGACYKKCMLLTNGELTVRSGSNTCCDEAPCTASSKSKASGIGCEGFGVGGALQPGHQCAHPPEVP